MKTIGTIVVIALIVYVALKFTAKKKVAEETQSAAGTEAEPQTAGEFMQQLVDQPAEVIQEKLNQIEQAVEEKVSVLQNPTPLISQAPAPEKIIMVKPKKVISRAPIMKGGIIKTKWLKTPLV